MNSYILKLYKNHGVTIPQALKEEKIDLKKLTPDELTIYKSHPLWELRGIGPSLAVKLATSGVTLENIKENLDKLPEVTQAWLKYNPITKIPHNLIPKIVEKFLPEKTHLITITGSYRRLTKTSGDIDLLYSGTNLSKFLDFLNETHKDNWIIYSSGDMKIAGIFKFSKTRCVEIDIWITTTKNKQAMLLYSTGSKQFNIIMRMIAKRHGYKLNQYGLFKGTKLIEIKKEKDFFTILGMKYKEPWER